MVGTLLWDKAFDGMGIRRWMPCVSMGCLLLLSFLLTACWDHVDEVMPETQTSIQVEAPEGVEHLNILSETLKVTNLSNGKTAAYTDLGQLQLEEGLYDCVYSADVSYQLKNSDDEVSEVKGRLSGKAENVEIVGKQKSIAIETFLSTDKDDFVFEEIFFAGTLRSSGASYIGDGYVKIYNNTDHVLYADGLALVEAKFNSTQYWQYTPDIRKDTMTIDAIYVIPGSGKEHPVQPGESLVLCDVGIDHRNANPLSFDLSHADFEWYDESSSASNMDIDSPTVPNLDKWYCYTQSIFILHKQGYKAYALARIPIGKEEYLQKYYYQYDYVQQTAAGTFYMTGNGYKLPNSWIVDGVNLSVESERKWNTLPPSVDAGWTYCSKVKNDNSRFFRSVRRKMQYLNEDGTMHLQDTNNSSEDFNDTCIPSLIEKQKTAIDVLGGKAMQETYDGVQVKAPSSSQRTK